MTDLMPKAIEVGISEVRPVRLKDVYFERDVGLSWEVKYLITNPGVSMHCGLVRVTVEPWEEGASKEVLLSDLKDPEFEFLFNNDDVETMSHEDFVNLYI